MRRFAAVVFAVVLLSPSIALGRPNPNPAGGGAPPVATSTAPTTSPLASPAPVSTPAGSLDTTAALGGTDAACSSSDLAGASVEVKANCLDSGLSQSAYPPGNYGTDTNVDVGTIDPGGQFSQSMQNIFAWVYEVVAHIQTWILLLLAIAFGFDLFKSDHSGRIGHGLAQAENLFSFPILPLILVIGTCVGCYYWFAHRSEGKAVLHWAAMLAMIGFALIIIQNPIGVFGWADDAAAGFSSGAVSALAGQGGGTTAGFSNATPSIWRTTMEEPWCAMEFGEVTWCMGPITPWMAAARTQVLAHLPDAQSPPTPAGTSVGATIIAAHSHPTVSLAVQQAPIERRRLMDAKTNGELFLAFPPNWDARNGSETWTLYTALENNRPDLASIRKAGGVGEHFGILILTGLAGSCFVALLFFITIQMLIASILFVVGLLMVIVTIFLPAFGEAGRKSFMRWLVILMEALFKRVIFAIFLGVILFATNVFLTESPSSLGGWMVQWGVVAAIWGMALAYHRKLLSIMTMGMYNHQGQTNPRRMMARQMAASRMSGRRKTTFQSETINEHSYGDTHTGDTYYQEAHVYGNGNGHSAHAPERSLNGAGVVDSSARPVDE